MHVAAGIAPIIGTGRHRYRYLRDWARLPRGWDFGDPDPALRPPRTAVKGACTAAGESVVVARSAHPVLVFDRDGGFVTAWGEGRFTPWLHGVTVARDGSIWIVDCALHTATRHAPDGALLQTLGEPNSPAPTWYGRPFNMPTGLAEAPDGTLYVSDGYGNRRVHRFAPDGAHLLSWGEPGDGPGQFALVHFLAVADDGTVHVCDRENDRVQIFDPEGRYLSEWRGFDRPSDIALGSGYACVVGADGITFLTPDGERLAHIDANSTPDGALRAHGVWLDADENIFIAQFGRVVSKLERV
jgi:DNA-binding beta-propeller fold protein YncE